MTTPDPHGLVPFEPWPLAPGGDAQTVLGTLSFPRAPETTRRRLIELEDGAALAVHESSPTNEAAPRGVVLLMHGLAGHAGMPYMVRAARRLVEAGFVAVRLDHRGAGSGAGLSRRLYCSALNDDVQAVLEDLARRRPGLPLAAVGFSMSGNILLRYLSERSEDAAKRLSAAVAVNPALDLSATMVSLERPRNRLYHDRFVQQLVEQAEAGARGTGRDLGDLLAGVRTVRQFDERLTSRDWGYNGAQDYYEKASSAPFVGRIAVPTLVIADEDDPIIPPSCAREATFSSAVQLLETRGGGHMGYLARRFTPQGDRRWMDYAVVAGLEARLVS